MGAHNVLKVYEDLVSTTADNSRRVIADVLSNASGLALSPDIHAMGDALMDGHAVTLVVYNPLASPRTEMVSLQARIRWAMA